MAETNASIVGAFLKGTSDFPQFTPANSQAAITEVLAHPYDPMNKMFFNQFQDFLVQRIGQTIVNSMAFQNPLKAFKGTTMRFGNTVQNIMLNFCKVYSYEDDAEDLFKREVLDGKVQYVSQNRRDKIPVTINAEELRMAFVDEYGINSYINNQIAMAVTTDEYVEYGIMKNMPGQQDKFTPLYRHPAYVKEPDDESSAKQFLIDLQAIADNMTLPNYGAIYSPAHMPTVAEKSDCVLLIKSKPKAVINVQAYAQMFNLDKGEAPFRIIFVDDFGIPGCFAALTTTKGFICNDTLYQTTSFFDPNRLESKYMLHHWELMGINLAAPWILFGSGDNWNKTAPQTVTMAPTGLQCAAATDTAKPGDVVQMTLTMNGNFTSDPTGAAIPEALEIAPDSATFEVSAAKSDTVSDAVLLNSRTYVDPLTGNLHIQKSGLAKGNVLTVKATSTYSNPTDSANEQEYTATCTVTIA